MSGQVASQTSSFPLFHGTTVMQSRRLPSDGKGQKVPGGKAHEPMSEPGAGCHLGLHGGDGAPRSTDS